MAVGALVLAGLTIFLWRVFSTAADYWILTNDDLAVFSFKPLPIAKANLTGFSPDWVIRTGFSTSYIYSRNGLLKLNRSATSSDGVEWLSVTGGADVVTVPGIRFNYGDLADLDQVGFRGDFDKAARILEDRRAQSGDSLEFRVLHAHVLAKAHRFAEAKELVEPLYGREPADWREQYLLSIAESIRIVSFRQDNAFGPDEWSTRFPRLFSSDYREGFDAGVIEFLRNWRPWSNPQPYSVNDWGYGSRVRAIAKTGSAQAAIGMMLGDLAAARSMSLGLIKWRPGGHEETSLIGVLANLAGLEIGLSGMADYLAASNDTADDLVGLWDDIETALRHRGKNTWKRWEILSDPALSLHEVSASPYPIPTIIRDDVLARERWTDARVQLLRQGVRVLHFRRATGKWPMPDADGSIPNLLIEADPVPQDPYSPTGHFFCIYPAHSDAPFILYSIGPDGVDSSAKDELNSFDHGQVGDIVIRLHP